MNLILKYIRFKKRIPLLIFWLKQGIFRLTKTSSSKNIIRKTKNEKKSIKQKK